MSILPICISRARRTPRTLLALLALWALAGCIRSEAPILTDAKPLLGETVRFRHYGLRDGAAHDPDASEFRWDGTRYTGVVGKSKDAFAFTVFPFEGRDFIVQAVSAKKDSPVEYALARKLADGVYLTNLIEEDDADEATRAKFCIDIQKSTCTIADREALFAFARASAAKSRDTGGLSIRLADD